MGWDLGDLARRYRRFIDMFAPLDCRADSLGATRAGETAFVLRTLLLHEYRKIHLRDPLLPAALLPRQIGPAPMRTDLCRNLYAKVFAASEQYLVRAVQTLDGALPPPAAEIFAALRRACRQRRELSPANSPALDQHLQEPIRAMAVHHAMIQRQRHVAARPHDDPSSPFSVDHDRPLLQLADAENRRLRLIDDDRRRDQAAADAMIGDRERAAAHVAGVSLSSRARATSSDSSRAIPNRSSDCTCADHRNDQAFAFDRRADADVDGVVDLERVVGPAAVHFRHFANRIDARSEKIRGERQRRAALLEVRAMLRAMREHRAQVDLEDRRDVRRRVQQALDHSLGDALAHRRMRHASPLSRQTAKPPVAPALGVADCCF